MRDSQAKVKTKNKASSVRLPFLCIDYEMRKLLTWCNESALFLFVVVDSRSQHCAFIHEQGPVPPPNDWSGKLKVHRLLISSCDAI